MEALSSAVTGLGTFQKALDVVGSNLANVSTPGYKATTISFQELIASVSRAASGPTDTLGGINPQQSVQGVKVGQQNARYTQGSILPTGKPTDLAITGDGFFVLRQVDGNLGYTRNGNFSLDKNGLMVNASGYPVQGWMADATGTIDVTSPVGALSIPLGQSRSNVTRNVEYAGVLDGSAAPPGSALASISAGSLDSNAAVGATATGTSANWIDNGGTSHGITYSFTKSVDNAGLNDTWDLTINGINAAGSWTGAATNATTIPVVFDAAGNVASVNGVAGATLTVGVTDTIGGTQNVAIDFSTLTNTATPVAVTAAANGTQGSALQNVATGQIYDTLGASHELTVTFTKIVPTVPGVGAQWMYEAAVDGVASPSTGTVCFTNTGDLDAVNSTQSPTITFTLGNGAAPLNLNVDFSGLANQAVTRATAVIQKAQDGTPPGSLLSIGVDSDGTINGSFSNGLQAALGRVALATFPNVQGLVGRGGGMVVSSAASGTPTYGAGGLITSGALENSNVDLGSEFTNMILAQRAFQANSKMVSVIDQVLAEVANLKNS